MPEPVGVLAFCQFCLQSSDALLQVGHLRWAALLRSCSIRVHGGLHNQMSDLASIQVSIVPTLEHTTFIRSQHNVNRGCEPAPAQMSC